MGENTPKRAGKAFYLGNPYLMLGGIVYSWPGSDLKEFERTYKEKRKELGEYLEGRAKVLIPEYGVRNLGGVYPYLQSGMNSETIHIGGDGRWIDFEVQIGSGLCSFHNMDSYMDRVMGFNLASDALEFLDEEILAPRIRLEEGKYLIEYALPEEFNGLDNVEFVK